VEPGNLFPDNPTYDEEPFKQMTSEKIVTEYQRGLPVRKRKKVYRNEVLGCRVYATAALMMREVNFKALLKNMERKSSPKSSDPKSNEEQLVKPEIESPDGLIHVVFARGIRWKGNHVGPGTEMDVSIPDARELLNANAIRDVKLPIKEQPFVSTFKLPSTKQLRRTL
jgi:hypothetical protein